MQENLRMLIEKIEEAEMTHNWSIVSRFAKRVLSIGDRRYNINNEVIYILRYFIKLGYSPSNEEQMRDNIIAHLRFHPFAPIREIINSSNWANIEKLVEEFLEVYGEKNDMD
jgi:hypothetical protein